MVCLHFKISNSSPNFLLLNTPVFWEEVSLPKEKNYGHELTDNKFKTLVDIVKVLSYIPKNEYQTIGQA